MKTGILILNLGTPDAPSPSKVRAYLREFLSDPRVLDIPALARWLLLHLIILPFRPSKAAAAYEKIWTAEGSPLLVNSNAFAKKLQASLPGDYRVEVAMRYGSPSMASGLERLLAHPIDELLLFPQYPQYASSSTGSSLEQAFKLLGGRNNIPPVRIIGSYYGHSGFIEAFAASGRALSGSMKPDHVLFSYHGLPERHIRRGESFEGHCLKSDDACCASMSWKNQYCYRAQCFETSRRIAAHLSLEPAAWSISFQSRLGRTPWIRPFTDLVLPELARQGKKKVLVFVPSFTADCLETLEEIALRARASFLEAGGERLELVPSLNASDAWVSAARDLVLGK